MKKQKVLKKHHAKPIRKRHIGVSLFGLSLLVAAAYFFGIGSNKIIENFSNQTPEQINQQSSSFIKSSLGFSFNVDQNSFGIQAVGIINGEAEVIAQNDLANNRAISSVKLVPNKEKIEPVYGATSLELNVVSDSEFTQKLATKPADQTVEQVVADYFMPVSSTGSNIIQISSEQVVVSGLSLQKRIYQVTNSLGGNLPDAQTFSVYWSGLINQQPINIKLTGLIGSSSVPLAYQSIFNTMSFDLSIAANLNSELIAVKSRLPGFSTASADNDQPLASKYVADLISPSVVKIYNVVCGTIVIDNQVASTGEVCNGGTGTGFIVSSNGEIATNGHVVVQEPTDLFVYLLLSDPNVLSTYLQASGLDEAEAAAILTNQQLLATLLAGIYQEAEGRLTLKDQRSRILVSIADEPVELTTLEDFFNYPVSDTVYEAKLQAYDYTASDLYSAQSIEQGDFTASDVALIKIDISNAPALNLASESPIQNESVTVFGFPEDAENSLVDLNELAVSVTNGVISSIRSATGSESKLYQSDVDASSGNSGGPAVNEFGQVVGLLTYRFKNDELVDASKSYIRDIADLESLAKKQNITLVKDSQTYDAWQSGLGLYSQNRFSKAKKEFELVASLYPNHRLAATYVEKSQTAIDEGRDISDFPTLIAIIGGSVGSLALAAGVFLFLRHNQHHKLHLLNEANNSQDITPNTDTPPIGSVPPASAPIQTQIGPGAHSDPSQTSNNTLAQRPEAINVASPTQNPNQLVQ